MPLVNVGGPASESREKDREREREREREMARKRRTNSWAQVRINRQTIVLLALIPLNERPAAVDASPGRRFLDAGVDKSRRSSRTSETYGFLWIPPFFFSLAPAKVSLTV